MVRVSLQSPCNTDTSRPVTVWLVQIYLFRNPCELVTNLDLIWLLSRLEGIRVNAVGQSARRVAARRP